MELIDYLEPGLTREESFVVEEQHTAYHIGSGDERVLGTPWMISFMELVSNRLVGAHLPDGYISVGFHLDVNHLAPTPVHARVRVVAEIYDVDKNRVALKVACWDPFEKIGEGIHKRAVVERVRFMEKVMSKG